MSAYLNPNTPHSFDLISPCHEMFGCTHRFGDKNLCSVDCKALKRFRSLHPASKFTRTAIRTDKFDEGYSFQSRGRTSGSEKMSA